MMTPWCLMLDYLRLFSPDGDARETPDDAQDAPRARAAQRWWCFFARRCFDDAIWPDAWYAMIFWWYYCWLLFYYAIRCRLLLLDADDFYLRLCLFMPVWCLIHMPLLMPDALMMIIDAADAYFDAAAVIDIFDVDFLYLPDYCLRLITPICYALLMMLLSASSMMTLFSSDYPLRHDFRWYAFTPLFFFFFVDYYSFDDVFTMLLRLMMMIIWAALFFLCFLMMMFILLCNMRTRAACLFFFWLLMRDIIIFRCCHTLFAYYRAFSRCLMSPDYWSDADDAYAIIRLPPPFIAYLPMIMPRRCWVHYVWWCAMPRWWCLRCRCLMLILSPMPLLIIRLFRLMLMPRLLIYYLYHYAWYCSLIFVICFHDVRLMPPRHFFFFSC